jgi:preprotein translocase subunit YajC
MTAPALILASSEDTQQASALPTLIIFLLIPLAMYFLLIRPQKRRQREALAMQSSIEVGDEVVTTSGMYGFVTGFDGDVAWLEIDDDVQVRISRQALARKVNSSVEDAPGDVIGELNSKKASKRSTKLDEADGESPK